MQYPHKSQAAVSFRELIKSSQRWRLRRLKAGWSWWNSFCLPGNQSWIWEGCSTLLNVYLLLLLNNTSQNSMAYNNKHWLSWSQAYRPAGASVNQAVEGWSERCCTFFYSSGTCGLTRACSYGSSRSEREVSRNSFITSTHIPLAKASYKAKPNISRVWKYSPPRMGGTSESGSKVYGFREG